MGDNVFQTALVGIFAALTIAGFIFFALFEADSDGVTSTGSVTIWGTVDQTVMNSILETLTNAMKSVGIEGQTTYREFSEDTFNDELVDALAAGVGPDLFIVDHQDILKQSNKIYVVPYEVFTERSFRDKYIEGAEIFTNNDGVLAYPFMVDPMIMFWNRDILSKERVVATPEYWDEFFTLSPKITKRDGASNLVQSTVAFGEYSNVTHAKEILSGLILQAGDPIVTYNARGQVTVDSGESADSGDSQGASESSLRFYSEFANPSKAVYSWNRSLPESKRAFLSGELAFYFGFASEVGEIQRSNPNLNFDIDSMPQIRDDVTPRTYANMSGVAILKSSGNISGARQIASLLSSDTVFKALNARTALPPFSRNLLRDVPTDFIQPVFYESAIIADAWLEPDREGTDQVFKTMIEAVSSGRLSVSRAVSEARSGLRNLIK